MAKNSITDYSKTAASNTDIQSVDIAEGCLPSGINNAIREIMADLADMNDGTVTLTSPSFAAASITGALTSGSATVGSTTSSAAVHSYTKLEIESSSHTALQLSGSTGGEQWIWFADDSSSTPVGGITYYHGGPYMAFRVEGSERMRITSDGYIQFPVATDAMGNFADNISEVGDGNFALQITNTAQSALKPFGIRAEDIRFATGSSERMRIDSSGNVGIGTSSPSKQLHQIRTGSASDLPTLSIETGFITQSTNVAASSQNISIISGNAGEGRLFFGDTDDEDAGNIVYSHANNSMSFDTAGSERMRIDSSGQVGIGTTSPSTTLTIDSGGTPTTLKLDSLTESSIDFDDKGGSPKRYKIGTNISSNDGQFEFKDMTANAERMRIDSSGNVTLGAGGTYRLDINAPTSSAAKITCDNTSMEIGTFDNHVVKFLQNNSERMRIDSSGNVLVGATSNAIGNVGFKFNSTGFARSERSGTSAQGHIVFTNANGDRGSITTNSTSTQYNTTSDYRLKENVTDITDGIERVKQLNPSRFNFIVDADTTVDGFLAHEAATVVPEAVTGEKDAVDADGNPDYQGIDQSKLVPLLTAALQEAITKIEDLEARVATLEGN